ncbi:MAG: TraR/DksA family transcriptional regulator [Gammaproteobacteria bacterium]|nr:TraR/DksA family transcriptional regulator [Gammaproteobacteria bacterium]
MTHQDWPESLKPRLEAKRDELTGRLERITANVQRSLDADSEERAKELADSEVVDALGNEAREELAKISVALSRMDSGDYGMCTKCRSPIATERMEAYPYADDCIDCAELDEEIRART